MGKSKVKKVLKGRKFTYSVTIKGDPEVKHISVVAFSAYNAKGLANREAVKMCTDDDQEYLLRHVSTEPV